MVNIEQLRVFILFAFSLAALADYVNGALGMILLFLSVVWLAVQIWSKIKLTKHELEE